MTTLLSAGPTYTLAAGTVYALPAKTVFLLGTTIVQVCATVDGSFLDLVGSDTTGAWTSAAFVKAVAESVVNLKYTEF